MRYADNFCTYTRSQNGDYIYSGKCIVTGEIISVTVPAKALYEYRKGKLIQDAMPTLSPDEREFLLTGISAKGWDKTFKKE